MPPEIDEFLRYFNIMELIILLANICEYIARGATGLDVIHDETSIGGFIKITKSLRFFTFLYTTNQLNPLNDLIYAFFVTFKEVFLYMMLIIVYTLALGCIGVEIFANTVRYDKNTGKPETYNLPDGIPLRINFDNFSNGI